MANRLKNKILQGKKVVMLVVNDFTSDSRVLKEAQSAQKGGFQVWVLARKSKKTKFRENQRGIKIIRLQTIFDKFWQKFSPKSQEVAGSQSGNIPKNLAIYAGILNTYFLNWLFYQEGLKIKPDFVHANDSTTLIAGYKLQRRGAKLIYDAHEFYSESITNPNPFWKRFFIRLEKKLKIADGIFSVNQSILGELDKRYGTKNILKTILFNASPYLKIFPKKKITKPIKILYLGHYMPHRGLEQMFEALKYLEDVKLTIYGKGFPEISDRKIKILPPVKPYEVVKIAQNYDIGVLPYLPDNLNHKYSTPNKFFDYMMAGLAIAASDLPEIRRIINQNQNGILFNPKDPKDIAQKIKILIRNPQKINSFQKNSLKAAQNYCWENQEKKQLELYSEVFKQSPLNVYQKEVFLAPIDFGLNQIFKKALKKEGFKVTTCTFVEHKNFGWQNDLNLMINKVGFFKGSWRVLRNFFQSLNYSIYHFKFGQSLLPWNLDLPLLKILGKKMIMNFHGLDIRQLDRFQRDKYNQLMVEKLGYSKFKEFKKRLRLHWLKIWVDKMVVSTPDLLEFVPEAEFVPEMAPIEKIPNPKLKIGNNKKTIFILHAPSHRGIKGTEFVKKAVKKLQEEGYKIKLLLAEDIPSDKMGEYYQKADIVVDQLLIGSYGVVSIEGMLAGKPVICYIRSDLRGFYHPQLPIYSANPLTCREVIKELVNNQARREKAGKESFKFVEKYHSPATLGRKWKEIYQSLYHE